MHRKDFLAWEQASKDTIDFKTIYVDMTGDLVAGLMLSQIVYWHLPGRNGKSKLRVKHKGYYWLAKQRDEWWAEIRISPKQVDRALKILTEAELIVKTNSMFRGKRTTFVRIDWERFIAVWVANLPYVAEDGDDKPDGNAGSGECNCPGEDEIGIGITQRATPVLPKEECQTCEDSPALEGNTGIPKEETPVFLFGEYRTIGDPENGGGSVGVDQKVTPVSSEEEHRSARGGDTDTDERALAITKTRTEILTENPSNKSTTSSTSPLLATQSPGLTGAEAFDAALDIILAIWIDVKERPPSRSIVAMLRRLALDYDKLARDVGGYYHWPDAGGAGWLVAAVTEALAAGVEDDEEKRVRGGLSVVYVRRILERWREQGGLDDIYAFPPEGWTTTEQGTAPEPATVFPSNPETIVERKNGATASAAEVWQRTLGDLQLQMTQATFETWLKDSRVQNYEGGTFSIEVKSKYAKEWLENRLLATVKRTVSRLSGQNVSVRFVVEQAAQQMPEAASN